MSSRQIASSTLWQLGSQVIMAALSMVAVKLVTIGLSKELAGYYNSAYGSLQLFGILADFGLYAVAVREVSRAADRDRALGAVTIVRCGTIAGALLLALLLVWFVPSWQATPLPIAVTIAALVPLFTLLAGTLRVAFQVAYRMHFVFIAEVSQRAVTVALIGLLILSGIRASGDTGSLYLFLLMGGIGAFLLFLTSAIFARWVLGVRPRADRTMAIHLLRLAAPYTAAYLSLALLRQFDVTLIALLRPDFALQNAAYGFALRITEMAFLVPTFLLNSVLPTLSARLARQEDVRTLLGRTLLILLALGSAGALFGLIWARPIMLALTSPAYLASDGHPGADTALAIQSLAIACGGVMLYAFYVLLAQHAWKPLVSWLSAGAAASVLLNVFLIPRFGFVGAAWTSVAIHASLAAALFTCSMRSLPPRISRAALARWALFTVASAAVLLFLRWVTPGGVWSLIGMAAGAVSVALLAVATGLLRFPQTLSPAELQKQAE
ncbi:MAG: Heteropolysaccharide repeat-containing protein [Candidatus Peregrinibacteria bacterium Gr01-1014_25]|nr:MAG: Heteropolysaccharide repeat-containing protein [Candidatus Peregrinibacteria bacterium Gr01-1014_25]